MCGIIGVFGNDNAARIAALGLFAEQHRGQEVAEWQLAMAC
jgi:amidophosphoribosyltransferase